VPAAALTSFPEVGHQKRARQAGFQMHLAKPVASEALVDAVARFAGLLDEVGGQIATVDDHDQRLITTQPFD
jgi:CheY-like chemotaxis protein